MAGPFDFTGQNIENTYQRVLQTPDGVNMYDGTGSLFHLGVFNNTSTGSYGSFYDTGSQTAVSNTVIYSMSLSTTDISNGVYVSGSDRTRIYFTNAGVYNLQFSAQFSNTGNNPDDVSIWIRKNDSGPSNDVPDSSGICTVPAKKGTVPGQLIASWNYYLTLAAGDFVQLCWHTITSNTVSLETIAAGTNPTHPRTPSLILTANRIDTFLSNTGSFSGSFTGVLLGTASNALTASYVNPLNQNVIITGSLTVSGSSTFTNIGPTVLTGSLNQGEGNVITGSYSHAEGNSTITIGDYSHAEGYATQASGSWSHAEGNFTQAIGDWSHTEGRNTLTGTTTAFQGTVVNGLVTLSGSYGDVTACFPMVTTYELLFLYDNEFDATYGNQSFQIASVTFNGTETEIQLLDTTVNTTTAYVGDLTYYINNNGLFGGNKTIPGIYSHAEGNATAVISVYSHVEGSNNLVTGNYSHAEGSLTQAIGDNSHAEGTYTQAIGGYSHAEGTYTQTIGEGSHAEGNYTITLGGGSHAEGTTTYAGHLGYGAENAITSGVYPLNPVYGDVTSEFPNGTIIYLLGSGVTGLYEVNTSVYVIPDVGDPYTEITLIDTTVNNDSNKYTTFKPGTPIPFKANIYTGNYSHTEGDSTIALGGGSHAEGTSTQALGNSSHTEGSQTITIGAYSHAEGGITTTTGIYSHAEGYITKATGIGSHAEGLGTVALGDYQHTQGQYNISSSAQSAFIIGNGVDNANRSNLVFASGSQFQVTGSLLIKDVLQLARRTTTPSPAVEGMIIASGSAGSSKPYYYDGTTWKAFY